MVYDFGFGTDMGLGDMESKVSYGCIGFKHTSDTSQLKSYNVLDGCLVYQFIVHLIQKRHVSYYYVCQPCCLCSISLC